MKGRPDYKQQAVSSVSQHSNKIEASPLDAQHDGAISFDLCLKPDSEHQGCMTKT